MSLTITFVPGYQFPEDGSVPLNYALINAMIANMTINLSGSIGSLTLADGSVTTVKLADNALASTATGRGKMQDGFFAADTISRAKFADGMLPIAKASTTFVNEATTKTTPVGADTILIADSAAVNVNAKATLTSAFNAGAAGALFTSAATALPVGAGLVLSTVHNLGALPTQVRWVLVCQSADQGYAAGDEIDCAFCGDSTGPNFSGGANATSVFLAIDNRFQMVARDGSTGGTTRANWKAKCYARL
jgi:hypothetical protein